MRIKKLFKLVLIGLVTLSACKARKVETEVLKASSTTNISGNEHMVSHKLDTGTVRKLTIVNKQSKSNGKTTIYLTAGKQFTYANGTFTGSADSVTQTGTTASEEQISEDSSNRYGITSNADLQKAFVSQATQTVTDKHKKSEATPIVSAGLAWILALVAAGFILWEAWQWIKNKV